MFLKPLAVTIFALSILAIQSRAAHAFCLYNCAPSDSDGLNYVQNKSFQCGISGVVSVGDAKIGATQDFQIRGIEGHTKKLLINGGAYTIELHYAKTNQGWRLDNWLCYRTGR